MRTAASVCLAMAFLATVAEGRTAPPSGDALEAAVLYAASDLDAATACVSLDVLPSIAASGSSADPLRELDSNGSGAIAAVRGDLWSTDRTRASLRAIAKSRRMRLADAGCAETLRVEVPRSAGDSVAVRVAVLHRGGATRERTYLLRQSGPVYGVVAKTADHIIVS